MTTSPKYPTRSQNTHSYEHAILYIQNTFKTHSKHIQNTFKTLTPMSMPFCIFRIEDLLGRQLMLGLIVEPRGSEGEKEG